VSVSYWYGDLAPPLRGGTPQREVAAAIRDHGHNVDSGAIGSMAAGIYCHPSQLLLVLPPRESTEGHSTTLRNSRQVTFLPFGSCQIRMHNRDQRLA
jgi:hypothetical protein